MPKSRNTTPSIATNPQSDSPSTVRIPPPLPSASPLDSLRNLSGITISVGAPSSRTRYREDETMSVTFTGNQTANVLSGSGNTYHTTIDGTTGGTCDCAAGRMGEQDAARPTNPGRVRRQCRHITAVQQATGIATAQLAQAVQPQVREEAGTRDRWRATRIIRREDDGLRLLDLSEAEQEAFLDNARQQYPDYLTENVLNNSPATFGIEIEVALQGNADEKNRRKQKICDEIRRAGLGTAQQVLGYHSSERCTGWLPTRDSSVDLEVVSPILKDTSECWEQLRQICNILVRNGATVDGRCGGHIHVGGKLLGDFGRRWENTFRLYGAGQTLIEKILCSSARQVRPSADHYAPMMNLRDEQDAGTSSSHHERQAQLADLPGRRRVGTEVFEALFGNAGSRYQALNISNLEGRKRTLEFRRFNGTLDPNVIQSNVLLAVSLMESARQAPQATIDRTLLVLQDAAAPETKKLCALLDVIATRARDRNKLVRAFYAPHADLR